MLEIVNSQYLGEYKISLEFNTREKGILDLEEYLVQEKRKVFTPLKNIEKFKTYVTDYTLRWGDLDLAPEFLYYQTFKKNPDKQQLFQKWGYN